MGSISFKIKSVKKQKQEGGFAKPMANEKSQVEQDAKPSKEDEEEQLRLAKAKAAAAAKAKAQALAKAKATAAPKAKADARAKKELSEASSTSLGDDDSNDIDEAKKKVIAAAKAKAAAKMKKLAEQKEAEEPLAPSSPNQPFLDKVVDIVKEQVGEYTIIDATINRLANDLPVIEVDQPAYFDVCHVLYYHPELQFNRLGELHGTDYESHMELFLYLESSEHLTPLSVKVKLERDNPVIRSVTSIWKGAEWPECEAYDLLGIRFEGHPNLRRLFLGEDWVGYPLRKDYEPYDGEV
jgi:NADH-quinone oxidoreductase subunit C